MLRQTPKHPRLKVKHPLPQSRMASDKNLLAGAFCVAVTELNHSVG